MVLVASLAFWQPWGLLLVPLFGYGFARMGHFAFEKNRPTTFQYPFSSLLGDIVLVKDVLTGCTCSREKPR